MIVGISSMEPQWAADGGADFYRHLSALGMRGNRLVAYREWDDMLETKGWRGRVKRAIVEARKHGIETTLVLIAGPKAIFGLQDAREFASWASGVAREIGVRRYVIWNEPDSTSFWNPGPKTIEERAAVYERLLRFCYDAIKKVDDDFIVSGMGLSHKEPRNFLEAVATAYRVRGDDRPLMDELSLHPYPSSNTVGIRGPQAMVRKVAVAYAASFKGTAQGEIGLRLNLDEIAWEVSVKFGSGYHGTEHVKVCSEATQAARYREFVRFAESRPDVRSVLFYLLRDEADLAHWQSGFLRLDGSRRPVYDAFVGARA